MQFIPDITDKRYVVTLNTKCKVKKCVAKQKVFLANIRTTRNWCIVGLDYFVLSLNITLRQALMG